ncbi:DoxX-like family protein [Maribacter spongiicola]|uniref:DoxX-like family protein n=1 Tax=Maribacter spongiicola TaxID=1206753 RepID=UPI003F94B712
MVWFLNGLVFKVLNLVPRHQEIVARILGDEYARKITVLIGISEIMMAVWVLSKYKSKFNAIAQMVIVLTMNLLEYYIAPDLLLWGKMNIVFALFFVALVYYSEFILKEHS